MFIVLSFDIRDDKVRYRVVKALKGYGVRVQKSVFECPSLTEKQYLELKDRLEGLIDGRCDSVRYYELCKGCLAKVEWSGVGDRPEKGPFDVI